MLELGKKHKNVSKLRVNRGVCAHSCATESVEICALLTADRKARLHKHED